MATRPVPFAMRAEALGETAATNAGRWMVYGGDEILLTVEGLSSEDAATGELQPIRVVVDLATLKPAKPTIIALRDHERKQPVGSWQDISISPAGIVQSLTLAQPSNPQSLVYVQELRDLLAAKTPLQASIGANPGPDGHWELIPAGQTAVVNGRSFVGGGDLPLYVLRAGVLTETSVVTFGADSTTGRIAAARTKEPSMSTVPDRLKKLLAAYPEKRHAKIAKLVAEAAKDDAAICAELDDDEEAEMKAAHEQLKKENDALKARCEAYEADMAALKKGHEAEKGKLATELAAAKAAIPGTVEAAAAAGAKDGVQFRASDEAGKPKTLTEAMKVVAAKDPKLTGFALRAAALREYPTVERR